MVKETTFIYALCDPDVPGIEGVRYVGKANSIGRRLSNHLAYKSRNHRGRWIQGLKTRGATPKIEVLLEVGISEWVYWEIEMIKLFRRAGCRLVNGTDGGDNPPDGRPGQKRKPHPLEARANMSAAAKGRKVSPEVRANMSIAQQARRKRAKVGA